MNEDAKSPPLPDVHPRIVDWLRREGVHGQVLRDLASRDLIAQFRPILT
jgi:hypothetical protein